MNRLFVGALLTLGACNITLNQWPNASAKATCAYQESCNRLAFNSEYSSIGSCVDSVEKTNEDLLDALEGCSFHREQAAACIDATHRSTRTCDPRDADDIALQCAEVITCGDGGNDTTDTTDTTDTNTGTGNGTLDSFIEDYAEASCKFALNCSGGSQAAYDACLAASQTDFASTYAGCTVDPTTADLCLSDLNAAADDCNLNLFARAAGTCADAFDCL
ncbi:MAG: hypothetical protein H6733_09510 [Alphaproteobacteria bacterium]|nr:hypothetical protein [Alphaproteobacteria bacterium]